MRVVVTDASAVLEYLLGTDRAASMGAVVRLSDVDLHAPALCDVEVAACLRRALMHGALSDARMTSAVEDYLDLPLTRHGHQALLPRILELRANFTAYDACYVALAERLRAELLTADEPLSRAVLQRTQVGVVADS